MEDRETILKKYLEELRNEQLFFNGKNFIDYIDSSALFRFQKWFGVGFCLEMSILAMILLKNNSTAKLCRGIVLDENSVNENDGYLHSWVEFKYFGVEYIFDLSWCSTGATWFSKTPGECPLGETLYYRADEESPTIELIGGDITLIKKWSIDHDDFWRYYLANQLYEAMKDPKTSFVFDELHRFNPAPSNYDIEIGEDVGLKSKCKCMIPFYLFNKPMAAEIMVYFVEHPDALMPDYVLVKAVEKVIERFKARAEELKFNAI